jgi:hypothetical protein
MAGNGNSKSLANLKPAWKPGESGNMNGRPTGVKNRATTARIWLEVSENINNPITGIDERLTQEDIITLAQIKSARSGDTQAYKSLMDSAYGAPKQELDVSADLKIGKDLADEKYED